MSFLSESKTIQKRFKVPPRCLNLLLLFYNYFLVHPPPPAPPAEGSEEVSEETVRHPLVGGPQTWRSLTSLSCRASCSEVVTSVSKFHQEWNHQTSEHTVWRDRTKRFQSGRGMGRCPEFTELSQLEFNLGGWDSMKRPSNSGFMFGRWRMMTVCVCVCGCSHWKVPL